MFKRSWIRNLRNWLTALSQHQSRRRDSRRNRSPQPIEPLECRMLLSGAPVVNSINLAGPATTNSDVLTGLGGTSTFIQNGAPVTIAPNIEVSSLDGTNIASATVSFTNWQAGDRVEFNNQFALQHSFVEDLVNHTAKLTITGNDTAAHYQTMLRSVLFWNVSGAPNTSSRTATFAVTDIFSGTGTAVQTIGVTAVNQHPLLSGIESTPIPYVLNHPEILPQPISGTLLVTDPDSNRLSGATVQITTGYQNDANGHDQLSFTRRLGITGAFDPLTGTLTLTGLGSLSDYRAVLQSVKFSSWGTAISTSIRTLTITAIDDSSPTPLKSLSVTRDITILSAPNLTGLGGTATFIQGGIPATIAPNLKVAYPDGPIIAGATVSFSNWQGGDRLEFHNQFALQHVFTEDPVAHTATLTITGIDTAAHYQTTLGSVIFWHVGSKPNNASRTATFAVTDVFGGTGTAEQSIGVTAVNQRPLLLAFESTPLAYAANHPEMPSLPISTTLLAGDSDSDNLSRATVQITSGYQNDANGHDLLSFTSQSGITGAFDAATGTLTLTGSSSVSSYRAALRSVTFSSSGPAISTTIRTLTITATDDSTPTPLTSLSVTRDVTVSTTNAAPTLSGLSGTSTYVKGSTPLPIASNLVVSDSDSAMLFGATISFSNWQDGDRLDFHNQFALQHTFTEDLVAHTASLKITGQDTLAHYQTMLRSIGFYNVAGNPILTARVASITVSDGLSTSNTATGNITVGLA